MIYKLFRATEWAAAQAAETAAKYFAGENGLILAEVDPARLKGPLKWEPSRGGALFPHLYDVLPLDAIIRTWVLPVGADGLPALPPDLR